MEKSTLDKCVMVQCMGKVFQNFPMEINTKDISMRIYSKEKEKCIFKMEEVLKDYFNKAEKAAMEFTN